MGTTGKDAATASISKLPTETSSSPTPTTFSVNFTPDNATGTDVNIDLNNDPVLTDRNLGADDVGEHITNGVPCNAQAKNQIKDKGSGSSAVFRKYLKRLGDYKSGGSSQQDNRSGVASLLILGALLIFFVISFMGFALVWFTDYYNNSILENLKLAEGSRAAKWWKEPPIDPLIRIHIFNYTNAGRWRDGLDAKLHVKDVGPYVYREHFDKVNVVFNPNHTISYRERRSYEFLPDVSTGRQYDTIVIPNALEVFSRHFVPIMNFFGAELFQTLTAHQLIWGHDNEHGYNIIKTLLSKAPDKFGMLAARSGTSSDTITINSGVDDIRKLALIDVYDGRKSLTSWATDECNRVDGTDGSQFPPHYMDKKHTLYVYSSAFCRRFPLNFAEEVNILDGIPVWRYKAPLDVFAHPDQNKKNQCFCDRESDCPPSGVFDAIKCFNVPIMLSYPHFFTGSPVLFEHFDGLNPREELHRSYADIHPRLAFPIGGASRIQINLQVPVSSIRVKNHTRFGKKLILPILWMELVSGDIAEELRATIYHSTFSTNAIELSLRYGSLLLCMLVLGLLVVMVMQRSKSQRTTVATTVVTLPSPESPAAAELPGNKVGAEMLQTVE